MYRPGDLCARFSGPICVLRGDQACAGVTLHSLCTRLPLRSSVRREVKGFAVPPPAAYNSGMSRPLSIFAAMCVVPFGFAQTRNSVPRPSQLYVADFPGTDLSARVTAALAALGGSPAHPVERATIHLDPAQVNATRTIVLSNSRTAPFVRHVELDCHGAVLAGADPDAPVVHILPENSNGGRSGSILRGCTIITPAHAPAVLVDSAVSVEITQNRFVGGAVQLKLLNTLFEDGRTPGYSEQHSIHANDFENPSVAGIEFAKANGTDSMEYGAIEWSNHFQLPCGAAAIQVDNGITIQGGKLGGRINTTPSPCAPGKPALAIRKEGAIYRGTSADFTGEDTGGLGTGNLFLIGGSGPATLETRTALVTGMSYKQSSGDPSHLTMPYFNFHSLYGGRSMHADVGRGTRRGIRAAA